MLEWFRQHPDQHPYQMKELYELLGISKQAHWAFQKRQQIEEDNWVLIEPILTEWRKRHPCMSLKKLYICIQPDFIGRNKFIDYGMTYGFEAVRYAKPAKTTIPLCTRSFPNLLVDLLIVDINQVWVSDITYFRLFGKFHYLVFIMDLYSRRIIGHHASKNLFAQANLETLHKAFKYRKMNQFDKKLIHHSDRGSQYNSLLYTDALDLAGIHISMGRIVYENIHMERANQTIKSEYLIHRNIETPQDLHRHLDEVVFLYNEERPHEALGMKTPSEFERYICNIPLCQRTPMRVFSLGKNRSKKNSKPVDPAQLELQFL